MYPISASLSPCLCPAPFDEFFPEETPVLFSGDASHNICGNDPWYAVGFGMGSMFVSPVSAESTEPSGHIGGN